MAGDNAVRSMLEKMAQCAGNAYLSILERYVLQVSCQYYFACPLCIFLESSLEVFTFSLIVDSGFYFESTYLMYLFFEFARNDLISLGQIYFPHLFLVL